MPAAFKTCTSDRVTRFEALLSITEGGRQTNKPSELRYSARVAVAMVEGQELDVVEAGPLTAGQVTAGLDQAGQYDKSFLKGNSNLCFIALGPCLWSPKTMWAAPFDAAANPTARPAFRRRRSLLLAKPSVAAAPCLRRSPA